MTDNSAMACRSGCGACCIAPSIASSIPGMPNGKPAGVRCVQLDTELRCKLFGKPERPLVCTQFLPETAICGDNREEALQRITILERDTHDERLF